MANIIEIGSWAPHCPPLAAHPQNSQAGLYTINIDLERIHVILEYLQHGQFWMHGTKMGAILWFCADFGLLKPLSLQLPGPLGPERTHSKGTYPGGNRTMPSDAFGSKRNDAWCPAIQRAGLFEDHGKNIQVPLHVGLQSYLARRYDWNPPGTAASKEPQFGTQGGGDIASPPPRRVSMVFPI